VSSRSLDDRGYGIPSFSEFRQFRHNPFAPLHLRLLMRYKGWGSKCTRSHRLKGRLRSPRSTQVQSLWLLNHARTRLPASDNMHHASIPPHGGWRALHSGAQRQGNITGRQPTRKATLRIRRMRSQDPPEHSLAESWICRELLASLEGSTRNYARGRCRAQSKVRRLVATDAVAIWRGALGT